MTMDLSGGDGSGGSGDKVCQEHLAWVSAQHGTGLM